MCRYMRICICVCARTQSRVCIFYKVLSRTQHFALQILLVTDVIMSVGQQHFCSEKRFLLIELNLKKYKTEDKLIE